MRLTTLTAFLTQTLIPNTAAGVTVKMCPQTQMILNDRVDYDLGAASLESNCSLLRGRGGGPVLFKGLSGYKH